MNSENLKPWSDEFFEKYCNDPNEDAITEAAYKLTEPDDYYFCVIKVDDEVWVHYSPKDDFDDTEEHFDGFLPIEHILPFHMNESSGCMQNADGYTNKTLNEVRDAFLKAGFTENKKYEAWAKESMGVD